MKQDAGRGMCTATKTINKGDVMTARYQLNMGFINWNEYVIARLGELETISPDNFAQEDIEEQDELAQYAEENTL